MYCDPKIIDGKAINAQDTVYVSGKIALSVTTVIGITTTELR